MIWAEPMALSSYEWILVGLNHPYKMYRAYGYELQLLKIFMDVPTLTRTRVRRNSYTCNQMLSS